MALPEGSNGKTVAAETVDVFAKFVVATPLADKSSGTVAQCVYYCLVCKYGCLLWARSDRGSEFCGHFEELFWQFQIMRFVMSPYYP